ncbi:MAG: polysaccharide deacetylase family protein [Acidobacteriota bacterium]|nr:MAG: polysaccharide deacetylase family protein [Acidobacteriota bacterium]
MLRVLQLLAVFCLLGFQAVEAQIDWPDGRRAAVVLTYDDGIDTHLDNAFADLKEFNLKGTFYVTGSSTSLRQRMDEWRELAQAGNELGNHTLFHPCLSDTGTDKREWVKPEQDLKNYSVSRIIEEIRVANTLLEAVDGEAARTYAYTCVDMTAGGQSFVEGLAGEFEFARGGGEKLTTDSETLDFFRVPSWSVTGMDGSEMIGLVKNAVERGGFLVLMFHGVGGEYLSVSREAHRELAEYLQQNRGEIWNDTFLNVMEYLKSQRNDASR